MTDGKIWKSPSHAVGSKQEVKVEYVSPEIVMSPSHPVGSEPTNIKSISYRFCC